MSPKRELPEFIIVSSLIIFLKVDFSQGANLPVWKVSESNQTCILLRARPSFVLADVNDFVQLWTKEIPLDTVESSGSCSDAGGEQQNIVLNWQWPGGHITNTNTLNFLFQRDQVAGKYSLISVTGTVFDDQDVGRDPYTLNANVPNQDYPWMPVSLNASFACDLVSVSSVQSGGISPTLFLNLNELQMEAFRVGEGEEFRAPEFCQFVFGVGSYIILGTLCFILVGGLFMLISYVRQKCRKGYVPVP